MKNSLEANQDREQTALLVNWFVALVYVGLLLSWQSGVWAVSLLEIGALVLGAVLLIRQISARETFQPAPDTFALAALVLWGPLQILTGNTVDAYATWNSAVSWLVLATIYLSAKALLTDRRTRSRFLSTEIWIGSVMAVLSILLKFGSPQKIFGFFASRYPPIGPFIYKNHYAVFIELLIPIAFYKMTSGKHRRAPYVVLFAALFACMVASLSRAGLLIAVGEIVVLVALSWARGRITWRSLRNIGLPILLLVVAFTLLVGWDAAWARFQEAHPFEARGPLVHSTIEMIRSRPLTGFGLGTWRTVYPQYAVFDIARLANEAHNDWLQWAADGGIGFAAVILGFAIYVSRLAWNNVWGLGVPAVFVHCLVDYATRSLPLAAFLFLIAGALAAAGAARSSRKTGADPEWQILSLRASSE